jgi:pimeloyl-ACP methyl ester carboxylesterase
MDHYRGGAAMTDAQTSGQAVLTRGVEGLSHSERPVRFRAGDDDLFGILTEPLNTPRGTGVILCNATSDRNRFLARLARRLAATGFHVLRFDYRGFAESSGPSTGSRRKHAMITLQTLDAPFTEDLLGAAEELRRRGLKKIVLIGRCFGGRTALSGVKHIRELRGIALISMPLHSGGADQHPSTRWSLDEVQGVLRRGIRPNMFRALLSPKRRARWFKVFGHAARQLMRRSEREGQGTKAEWLAGEVVDAVREIVERRVPLLFLYGDETLYKDLLLAQAGPLSMLAGAGDRVTVSHLEGPVNILTDLRVQEAVIVRLQEWLVSAEG